MKDAKLIVFSGVDFMAEMASILHPHKKVAVPDPAHLRRYAAGKKAAEIVPQKVKR